MRIVVLCLSILTFTFTGLLAQGIEPCPNLYRYNQLLNETSKSVVMPDDLSDSKLYLWYVVMKYAKTPFYHAFDNAIHKPKASRTDDDRKAITDMIKDTPKFDYEGVKHWNVERALYNEYYGVLSKEELRKKDTAFVFEYFLAVDNKNKETAWENTKKFMCQEIEPLLQSKFYEFQKIAYKAQYTFAVENVFDVDKQTTYLLGAILGVNYAIRTNEDVVKGLPVYTKDAAFGLYKDFFMYYRKDTPQEAASLASLTFKKELNSFMEEKNRAKSEKDKDFYKLWDF